MVDVRQILLSIFALIALASCSSSSYIRGADIDGKGASISDLTFHPDGDRLVFSLGAARAKRPFVVMTISTGQVAYLEYRELDSGDRYWTDPSISDDGSNIVFVVADKENNAQIAMMDADGRNARKVTSGPGFRYIPSFSAEGSHVLYAKGVLERTTSRAYYTSDVFELNLQTREERRLSDFEFMEFSFVDYAGSDERIIFSANWSMKLELLLDNFSTAFRKKNQDNIIFRADKNRIGREDLNPFFRFGDHTQAMGVSSDGNSILFVARINHLKEAAELVKRIQGFGYDLFMLKDRVVKRITHTGRASSSAALSKDGSRVAFVAPRIETKGWGANTIWVVNSDGSNLRELAVDIKEPSPTN